jgi:hypothetical protein
LASARWAAASSKSCRRCRRALESYLKSFPTVFHGGTPSPSHCVSTRDLTQFSRSEVAARHAEALLDEARSSISRSPPRIFRSLQSADGDYVEVRRCRLGKDRVARSA